MLLNLPTRDVDRIKSGDVAFLKKILTSHLDSINEKLIWSKKDVEMLQGQCQVLSSLIKVLD